MKFLVLLALVAVAFAAPQPKKIFHENFDDFMELIGQEAGDELEDIIDRYFEFEEFRKTIDYIKTANFKDLVYEMESLPEFKAVLDYLDGHSIDVYYFIDQINTMLEYDFDEKKTRQAVSGSDFSSYIKDSIAAFPKEQLAALYEQKLAEDEDFKAAIEGLQSDEWNEVYSALWASEQFLAEVNTLAENGIDVSLVIEQMVAVFGQN
ncbi:hypothetical protein ABMA28_007782 [Loxostege sticticalis]|uniref:Single domain major allergen protein n=1 Tax=Loxostege sticticalis TaxID=481309 RepID=A0ABD0SIR2_LOXSC